MFLITVFTLARHAERGQWPASGSLWNQVEVLAERHQRGVGIVRRHVPVLLYQIHAPVSIKRSDTATEVGQKVLAMSGAEIRHAAVQGSEKIVDAVVGARLRFALYLV